MQISLCETKFDIERQLEQIDPFRGCINTNAQSVKIPVCASLHLQLSTRSVSIMEVIQAIHDLGFYIQANTRTRSRIPRFIRN